MSDSDKVCKIMNCEHYSDCVCSFCDCIEKAYNKGRADAEAKWIDLPKEYAYRLDGQSYQRGRRDAVEKIKEVVKNRLVDNLGLKDATKYGNKNVIQQMNSYATVMKYEIADCVEDLIDDLEQMKREED